jgi:oligoendopeptidase F
MSWDLKDYFPEFDGPEMRQFKADLEKETAELTASARGLKPLNQRNGAAWQEVFLRTEDLYSRLEHLASYIGCLSAADATNEDYLREEAAMARMGASITKLEVELLRALKDAPDPAYQAFIRRKALRGATHQIERMRQDARFTMSPGHEALAADLAVDGIDGWGRLYDTVSSKLEFDMVYPDDRKERTPMSQRRSLMENSDRNIRKAAFEGGNAAWQQAEDVAAAALNAISGTRHTLNRYREVNHFLDRALFQSGIGQKTLDAMFEAIFSEIDLPRKILKSKARNMGLQTIAWYDLGAPLPLENPEPISWEQGREMVGKAFSRAYPALEDYLQQVFDRRWVDYEPRKGKRPGAFCTGSSYLGQSRVFMTYNRTLGDVLTLAHEVGHAYHSHVMRSLRPFAQYYPMTLAESASTFGEMILIDGILGDPDISAAQKALILDTEVGNGAIYLLDIPVRFQFEKALYEQRACGELSVSQLKRLMADTQRDVLGEVLNPGDEDPYFWASKLHFYITGVTFYNFPYTFGYLLSRGLFAQFKESGPDFLPRYEDFLRLTGSDTVENVARRSIDQDLEQPDFWVSSIRSLREPTAQLQELVPSVVPGKEAQG